MAKLFSQRNRQPELELRYEFFDHERERILYVLAQIGKSEFEFALNEVAAMLRRAYGRLVEPTMSFYSSGKTSDEAISHFRNCSQEGVLDFIEAFFQTEEIVDLHSQATDRLVREINELFLECGLGFELTPFMIHTVEIDRPPGPVGIDQIGVFRRTERSPVATNFDYPQIILKSSQFEHEQIVKPALELLRDRRFQVANNEMLSAHEDYRNGKYDGAITKCGSAFESVLKTVCDLKGWTFDPNKDTTSILIRICKDNSLFPGFYAPIFEAAGTIRNKLSDGHGRGPSPLYTVEKLNAEHMIQMTSSHILFLVKSAGL
jgi:hypothetical protein